MTLVFHPLAERELIAAARFYETHASGLGADFIRQVEHTLADVVAHPNAGVLFAGSTIRRRLMHRFPFGIVYEIESENISVSPSCICGAGRVIGSDAFAPNHRLVVKALPQFFPYSCD